eukprot:CAMPEP_0174271052 /NCGR_PEP_ID=MMETSP0439-20130205/46624_1 /TAXON_ID=0 /ORGANISM="Stereomyxa ramosa, Strain Chinc5" /LENGTH=418 /DNA_ID=CAMNT_0015360803 /DNA_START=39 /DNA_END=1296 /DNA_ORIENTATION=+
MFLPTTKPTLSDYGLSFAHIPCEKPVDYPCPMSIDLAIEEIASDNVWETLERLLQIGQTIFPSCMHTLQTAIEMGSCFARPKRRRPRGRPILVRSESLVGEDSSDASSSLGKGSLMQSLENFWTASIVEPLVPRTEEIIALSSALLSSCHEAVALDGTSLLAKVRAAALLEAFHAFDSKASSLLQVLRGTMYLELLPLVEEVYSHALNGCEESDSEDETTFASSTQNVAVVTRRAAQGLQERILQLLKQTRRELDSQLESVLSSISHLSRIIKSKENSKPEPPVSIDTLSERYPEISKRFSKVHPESPQNKTVVGVAVAQSFQKLLEEKSQQTVSRKRKREETQNNVFTFNPRNHSSVFEPGIWADLLKSNSAGLAYVNLETQIFTDGLTILEVEQDSNSPLELLPIKSTKLKKLFPI